MRLGFIISLLYSFSLFGQTVKVTSIDTTVFDKYEGKIKFGFYEKDSSTVKHGRVSFVSELVKNYTRKEFNKLIFTGNYNQGKKNGNWSFTESNFDVIIDDIKESREFGLDYTLNGIEYRVTMSFLNGVPDGKWTIAKSNIRNKKRNIRTNFGSINFKNGYLIGEINYENEAESIKLKANVNDAGFLDGIMSISYIVEDKLVNENRLYKDGFLLRLERSFGTDKNPYETIEFRDISAKLDSLLLSTNEHVVYEISEEGFGITFNNGYADDDERLVKQTDGNAVFDHLLRIYSRYLIPTESEDYQLPKYKLTRRLKFTYPVHEDSLAKKLRIQLNELCDSYDDFLNQPRYKLYKEKSDTLAYAMSYINMASSKCALINEELKRIESGFFEYQYRDNFYSNGIRGINRNDNIIYVNTKQDTVTSLFSLNTKIKSSDSLIEKMMLYVTELKSKTDVLKKTASEQVKLFKEQDEIDQLDIAIIKYQELNDSLYRNVPLAKENLNVNTLTFSQKLYIVYNKNHIKSLKESYLTADEFEDKKAYGVELSCILKQFANEYERIQSIDRFQKSLDSTFTLFKEHPFDDRLFESPILGNIREKGGNVLFNHYAEELFRSGKCKDISSGLIKIERLQVKLIELVKKHDDDEVVQINRFIRRENVPARIERMLEIN